MKEKRQMTVDLINKTTKDLKSIILTKEWFVISRPEKNFYQAVGMT